MKDIKTSFLGQALVEPIKELTSSEETLNELDTTILAFRERISAGEQLSLEECKLITVWFRARRAKAGEIDKKKVTKADKKQMQSDKLLEEL